MKIHCRVILARYWSETTDSRMLIPLLKIFYPLDACGHHLSIHANVGIMKIITVSKLYYSNFQSFTKYLQTHVVILYIVIFCLLHSNAKLLS
jgi:hypothetical protein